MTEELIERTLSWLREELPGVSLDMVRHGDAFRIDLPAAPGADYHFRLYFQLNGQREIHAVPLGIPEAEDVNVYFWSRIYEPEDHLSLAELAHSADATLRELLRSRTRIRQRRGLLFGSFVLERQRQDSWITVSSAGYFRWSNFRVPQINGRERVYRSPGLTPPGLTRG